MSAPGSICKGLGGGIRLWLVVDVWGTGSERGEDGEYHH
jgi:hypothetical protein